MKKLSAVLIALAISAGAVNANPVTVTKAKSVAATYYRLNSPVQNANLKLVYTETEPDGTPLYYVFNVNSIDGFVIVSAEDALHPVIGYSTVGYYGRSPRSRSKGNYKLPDGFVYLMGQYEEAIRSVRKLNIAPNADLVNEWDAYATNHPERLKRPTGTAASVAPLMQTLWDQDPYYDYMCPDSGGIHYCVTGCVATTMSQIMRYWAYPGIGKGSSSYNAKPYGTLSANYAKTSYNWQEMPLMLDTANNQVATIMSQAGISVQMSYAPSGSGAQVVGGNPSAQYSYPNYFGYSSSSLKGGSVSANSSTYTSIETELSAGRVVQYAGQSSEGGHTWVCDGDNTSTSTPTFHMNWGWSGECDAYFDLSNLSPAGTGLDFSSGMQTLTGIEPPMAVARFEATQQVGCAGMSVTFTDQSLAPNTTVTVTARSWSFPGGNPATSTATNPVVTYSTPGTYNVTEVVTSSGGSDTVTKTNYITVVPAASTLPYTQGFENVSFPPAGWTIQQGAPGSYVNYGVYWAQNSVAGGFDKSKSSMSFNNLTWLPSDIGIHERIYTPAMNFTPITSSAKVYFDVAYAPYGTLSGLGLLTDTLNVYYSTDCGATWTQAYSKGGMTLATADTLTCGCDSGAFYIVKSSYGTDTVGYFKPTKSQWRTDTIDLPSAVCGMADVMFAFEDRSGNGDPIYIDNVNVTGSLPTSVNVIADNISAKVFPNPNNGEFTVQLSNSYQSMANSYIKIYNDLGQEVYSTVLNAGNTKLNLSGKATGMYFYRIMTESGKFISDGKLMIQ
ncbi:MAG: C10 family peptidase [Bacteroidia bacterium]